MARKRYTAEEIICHLRTVEIEAGKGLGIADACRKLGITEQTFYRWKQRYAGLESEQVRAFKQLQDENAKLKRLVADLSLDKVMLQDVLSKNF
jgi:putative transposase